MRAQRSDGLDGGFADDSAHLGLTVDVLTHLATNLSVDSENFCHCVLLFNVIHFVCSSSWRVGMCTYRLALKDVAKVQGWQKSNSGIVGLRGDKGGLGRIKEDMRRKLGCGEGVKRGMDTLIFEKIGVNRAIKKPRQARGGGLPWLKSKENLLFPQIIYSSIYPE